MRTLDEPRRRLVEEGRFAFGTFSGPFGEVNPLDAARPFGFALPRPVLAFRLKEWQAFQFGNGRYFLNVALFNAKTLSLAQVKLYDRETGTKHLFERKLPPWTLNVARGLLDSETVYEGRGCRMRFENALASDRIGIHLDIDACVGFPRVRGSLTVRTDMGRHLVVAQPFADNRGMYSHKGLFAVEGELEVGPRRAVFEASTSVLLMDDHKGYYPSVMEWDWVTAAGFNAAGERLGFNLTRNQCVDPDGFNENAVFIADALHLLPTVRFEREGYARGDVWTVRDEEGMVDVRFTIEAPGRVDINALIVRTDYHGPFGTFEGVIRPAGASEVPIEGLFGMGERFYLRC